MIDCKSNRLITVMNDAIKLANQLLIHPQNCMNADKRSAYYATFDAKSFNDAFEYELAQGLPIINEAQQGVSNRYSY
jgi:hypothetical protein